MFKPSNIADLSNPRLFAVLALIVLAAPPKTRGFEPDSISRIKASPDGRKLVVATSNGQLGTLDFEGGGAAMPVFTNDLGDGFNWSPDGSAILYVERIPGQAPQIVSAGPSGQDTPLILVGGEDWKADPFWLKPKQLFYRTDWQSDRVRAVTLDAGSTLPLVLAEATGDVAMVWPSPLPGEFVYATPEAVGYSLHWRGSAQGEVVRLHAETSLPPPGPCGVALSPGGTRVAFVRTGAEGAEVVLFDLDLRKEQAVIQAGSPPRALVMMDESRVVMESGDGLVEWRPDRPWLPDRSRVVNWNGIELTQPVRLADGGMAAVIGEKLIVTAGNLRGLPSGKIHTSRIEDLLELSTRLQAEGHSREASRMMDQLWAEYRETPKTNLLVASTRAMIERIQPRPGSMEEWIERTIELADPAGEEFVSAWHSRLIQKCFEDSDAKGTRELLRALPENASQYPLVDWIREWLALPDEKLAKQWTTFIRGIRRKRWDESAGLLLRLATADLESDFMRRGVALLVRGEFEPLVDEAMGGRLSYPELMKRRSFQKAVVLLAGADLSPELMKDDFRGMLLLQWARGGQMEAARDLVQVDLSDPMGSSLDYDDILSRYLLAEEQEAWVVRSVDEIFLSSRIGFMLQRHMNVTASHLIYSLARTKNALLKGEMKTLDSLLAQLDNDLLIIPADYWSSNNAFLLFLIRLYRAKQHEAMGRWEDALNSYSQAEQVLERFPSDWEIIALDLGMARAALESGRPSAGENLGRFLEIMRQLGDPLISPAHEPARISAALERLQEMEKEQQPDWLKPFVAYGKGLCLQLLSRPSEAIVNFRAARVMSPPPGLLARILLEEAAARSVLTQSRLAAGLLAEYCGLSLKPPQLVVGIKARAQAERDAGMVASQEERLRQLCREHEIPWFWAATLIDALPAGDTAPEPKV